MKSMVPDFNIKDTNQYQWMHMDAIIPLKINVLKGYLGHSPCNVSDDFDNGKPWETHFHISEFLGCNRWHLGVVSFTDAIWELHDLAGVFPSL